MERSLLLSFHSSLSAYNQHHLLPVHYKLQLENLSKFLHLCSLLLPEIARGINTSN